ncbi:PTS cellobiose transporter subunit IIA [Lactococcus hodotermopsidis]|uniref:PTS cellobiose transporter subunit IIA n=1 Tax=Pseudolactococcus hodotermopsidis TaxID=2709157 RepID=A0A6A0BD70_9LACT|nr:PTS lactose/cellobiose transporter subunit IIA [Lactococcus hodotermopsidis]GFH42298.1 PTS cellobiose transporter subunit IIA [Lactococcus hodotermopsidis]
MNDEQMAVIMPLIIFGGEAKSSAIEAIQAAKAGDFDKADERIKAANGEEVEVSIYMVHAQDHLMTGIAFVDLAKEIIALYKVIKG